MGDTKQAHVIFLASMILSRKYDKSPSDKIPFRQNPLQISIQTESPRTQSPPDEIPSRQNPLTKQLFQKTFLDKNPSDKSPSRQNPHGQNPLETNSPPNIYRDKSD